MAIADFLNASIRGTQHGNFHAAMACVCIALDATAKLQFGGKTRARCLRFVNEYLDIITCVGFNEAVIAKPGATLNLLDPTAPGATKNVTEIIYDSIRCALVHEANLPFNVDFTDEPFYGRKDSTFRIPIAMITALLLATICSPINAAAPILGDVKFGWKTIPYCLDTLRGDPIAVRSLLGV